MLEISWRWAAQPPLRLRFLPLNNLFHRRHKLRHQLHRSAILLLGGKPSKRMQREKKTRVTTPHSLLEFSRISRAVSLMFQISNNFYLISYHWQANVKSEDQNIVTRYPEKISWMNDQLGESHPVFMCALVTCIFA